MPRVNSPANLLQFDQSHCWIHWRCTQLTTAFAWWTGLDKLFQLTHCFQTLCCWDVLGFFSAFVYSSAFWLSSDPFVESRYHQKRHSGKIHRLINTAGFITDCRKQVAMDRGKRSLDWTRCSEGFSDIKSFGKESVHDHRKTRKRKSGDVKRCRTTAASQSDADVIGM